MRHSDSSLARSVPDPDPGPHKGQNKVVIGSQNNDQNKRPDRGQDKDQSKGRDRRSDNGLQNDDPRLAAALTIRGTMRTTRHVEPRCGLRVLSRPPL